MARHALACACGDCRHWEIIGPTPSLLGFLGTAWAHPRGHIRCVTCGREFAVTIVVDPSTHLVEVPIDVEAVGMPVDVSVDEEVPVILDVYTDLVGTATEVVTEAISAGDVMPTPDASFDGGESGGGGSGSDF